MADEASAPERLAEEGLPEEDFEKLMGSISAMAPLLKGFFAKEPPGAAVGGCHRREALLLALRPYLSPARSAAVDYFIRLARVGDAIRSLQ